MKCPNCDGELEAAARHGVGMMACPKCHGLWLTPPQLNALEDKAFDLGDDEKGSLVLESQDSGRKCPECGKPMKAFDFRAYDLQLETCVDGHGYFLDAGEDAKVLDWMREEEARLKRSGHAEKAWGQLIGRLHSSSFADKLRNLFS